MSVVTTGRKPVIAAAAATLLAWIAGGNVAAQAASAATFGTVACQKHALSGTIPGSVMPDGVALPYTVAGELCATPAELHNGATAQLLIHGATYNHAYWDFGTIDGVRYSYARDLAGAGFPTFAIDQIGVGQSTKPMSSDVNNAVAAYIVHEAVQVLKGHDHDATISGSAQVPRFGRVIAVGHSVGSMTVWQEAITYHDVDGVIVTGAVHHATVASENFALYPAGVDPKFNDELWATTDYGYLTTPPGGRGFYYNNPDADNNVIAADDNQTPASQQTFSSEAGKDAFSSSQIDALNLLSSTATRAINVPVLVILGSRDNFYCGPDPEGVNFDCSTGRVIADQEAPYYSTSAHLEGCAVPNSGHDISLHYTFWVQEAAASAWSYHFVGQSGIHSGDGELPKACG